MWQSLTYKMNYRCGDYMSVCLAGQPGGAEFTAGNSCKLVRPVIPLVVR